MTTAAPLAAGAEARLQRLTLTAIDDLREADFGALADELDARPPETLEALRDRLTTYADDISADLRAELWPKPGAAAIVPVPPAAVILAETDPSPRKVVQIPVKLIRPSLYQPRTGPIDVSDIQPSIERHGLIHPIWVRTVRYERPDPLSGESTYYEMVQGERRLVAHCNLRRETIDAEVHDELTDLDVYLIQADENDKRRPLTALEQADVVARLYSTEEGGFALEIAEIALRLGIEARTAYRRLTLSRLGPEGREAFTAKNLLLGAALAIAVLPLGDQAEAVKLTAPEEGVAATGRPRSLTEVERLLDGRFHLPIAGVDVPFDPTRTDLGAPACKACPKRIDGVAQLDIFERVDEAANDLDARCPDRTCHRAKADATWAEQLTEAVARDVRVLEPKETFRLFMGSIFIGGSSGLVDLGTPTTRDDLFGPVTYGQIAGDAAPAVALVRDPRGRGRWLAEGAAVEAALAAAMAEKTGKPAPAPKGTPPATDVKGPAPAAGKGKDEASTDPTPDKPADPLLLQRQAEEDAGLRALGAIVAAAARRQVNVRLWRFLATRLVRTAEKYFRGSLADIVERRALRKDEAVHARARKVHESGKVPDALLILCALEDLEKDGDACALVVELLAAQDGLHPGENEEHPLVAAARFYGVDFDKLTADALKERKKATRKKPAKEPPPKAESPAAPAAPPPAKELSGAEAVTLERMVEAVLDLCAQGTWSRKLLADALAKKLRIPVPWSPGQDALFARALVDAKTKGLVGSGDLFMLEKKGGEPKRKLVGPVSVGALKSRALDVVTRHEERVGKKVGMSLDDLTAGVERDLGELTPSGKKVLASALTSLFETQLEEGDDRRIRLAPPAEPKPRGGKKP